ncbi:MAG: hypothetical protein HQM00_14405 [Magnetococcales bacterium]|nr:hypothetical protein [Magnetococcales bacterium]
MSLPDPSATPFCVQDPLLLLESYCQQEVERRRAAHPTRNTSLLQEAVQRLLNHRNSLRPSQENPA